MALWSLFMYRVHLTEGYRLNLRRDVIFNH